MRPAASTSASSIAACSCVRRDFAIACGLAEVFQGRLISDPPFSRLDLVSCRNLLIYFDTDLQKKLIPLFHYALRSDGYLFLGSSESLSEQSDLFRTADKPHRIFQRKQTLVASQVNFPLVDRSTYRQLSQSAPKPNQQSKVTKSIERVLLQDYVPGCVIINEQNDIVYFFGRTGKYLEPTQGVPSNNLFDLARRGLRPDLRSAIRSAKTSGDPALRERVLIETEGQIATVNLIVRPVRESDENSDLLMVIFQDVGKAISRDRAEAQDDSSIEEESLAVQQLEEELRVAKEHLRSTVEELETSNEELKSANEELLSINEELQSSNEELQTSKEEMQSINEELQTSKEEMQSINEELETVNSELRSKVEELDAANSDVQNLFESTRIATVFLDSDLRIKRFTPTATYLFSFIYSDIGRPITDLSLPLVDVDIAEDVQTVLRSLSPIEREVQFSDADTYYNMRVMPYRTTENAISGAVLTFVDITGLRQARNRAEQWAQRQSAIAEIGTYALQDNDAATVCDRATRIVCQTLKSDLCGLFVAQPDDLETLLLESGSGWPDGSIGTATLSAVGSHPGYTLNVQQRVTVEDFSQESRFSQSVLLQNLGITSGISTIVYGEDRPYGVLTAHAIAPTRFTPEDISFLQSVANALAATLQREKTAQVLQKNRERLDLALDAGSMGVWELDLATGTSTWNRSEYELLGLDPDASYPLSADLFYQHIHPDDVAPVQQALESAIAQGTEFNSEFRIDRMDAPLRWLAAKARVVLDGQGNAAKVIGVNYDITDRKQNEEALRAADRRKDDFLAALGHELRNPLNAISGSFSLMKKLAPDEATAAAARPRLEQLHVVADRQLAQLTHLVDDLLDVSRVAYQKIQLRRRPMDIVRLMQELVEDAQNAATEKDITINVSLPSSPIWIEGDTVRLTQAFSNVIQNSIKFSDRGSPIELTMALEERLITTIITDTGMGIESEALSRIFTAFSQEDRSLARSGGLGLGLPLAKGIIELHGGRIWASSGGRGKGTEVTVLLHALDEVSASAVPIAPAAVQTADPSTSGCILVVEDDEDSAFFVQIFLEDLGYQVEVAGDGRSGLALASQLLPHVIISDIGLTEEMDGYALATAIREDSQLSDVYLIAASGYGQPEDKARARDAGFDQHLTKPIDLDRLGELVAQNVASAPRDD